MRTRKHRLGSRHSVCLRAFGIVILAVGVLACAILLWYLGEYWLLDIDLSPVGLQSLVGRWGAWAPVASVLMMVVHSLVPFPAGAIAIVNGMLFGPVYGTFVTWLGAMAGALLAYGIGRWCGKPVVERLVPARFRYELDRWSDYIGPGELIVVRLVPLISFNLINYGAGVAAVSLWTFAWTTAVGILPLTIMSVLIGNGALAWSPAAWLFIALGSLVTLFVARRLACSRRALAG